MLRCSPRFLRKLRNFPGSRIPRVSIGNFFILLALTIMSHSIPRIPQIPSVTLQTQTWSSIDLTLMMMGLCQIPQPNTPKKLLKPILEIQKLKGQVTPKAKEAPGQISIACWLRKSLTKTSGLKGHPRELSKLTNREDRASVGPRRTAH
jgi:hypothetical protein